MRNKSLIIGSFAVATLLAACAGAAAADSESPKSVFKYREIFLPESTGDNAKGYGLNSLDHDWGIWGHNLDKVLPDDFSETVYAKHNGNTIHEQFCFSSERLYDYIEDYIDSKYDDDEQIRFAIMPEDNDIVCLCEDCISLGNTHDDASPAAMALIKRLAARFPNHLFFTSYYRTTKGVPTSKLPENIGVLVSAMEYPLSPVETQKEKDFIDVIRTWKLHADRILVWDYINNFDDYFTPFPVFDIMQRRLKLYEENGVTAVFLNGSGTDYSTFSKLKAEVLAKLTENPEADWKAHLKDKAAKYYPVTGNVITDFLIAQEDFVKNTGKELPLYEGVQNATATYLPEDKFRDFYKQLKTLQPQTSGDEKDEVNRLVSAMALTMLELNRINGNLEGSEELLNDLSRLVENDAPFYSEASWSVENYVADYKALLKHYNENGGRNLLRGEKLAALTPLDPDYNDISILTDGLLGIPSNYHNGNMIMSPDEFTKIAIPHKPEMKKLVVCLSYNPVYRVNLPDEVSLSIGGKTVKTVNPGYPENSSGHVFVEFPISSSDEGSLVVTLGKNPESHSMAVDEIEAY